MRRLYNIIFSIGLLMAAPFLLVRMWLRGGWKVGFNHRFGRYDAKLKQSLTNRHVLWLHVVNARDVNTCANLIQALEARLPNAKLVVSTCRVECMKELRSRFPSHIAKIYSPLDRRVWVARALATMNPEAIILVETEMWPNFLWRARHRQTPVFVVATRTARHLKRYQRMTFLFERLFRRMTGVAAQTEQDRQKFIELGCKPEAVRVVGTLKFDTAKLIEKRRLDVTAMLLQVGVAPGARVLIGGSTHAGEEAALTEIFLKLRKRFPDLFLILAPRQVERSREVGKLLRSQGLKFVYRNEVMSHTQFGTGELDCLLVNTQGELRQFYAHASVVFIGRSLTARGGHNPIEAGAAAKPVVFGPYMDKFRVVADQLLAAGAAIQVRDATGLETAIGNLLADDVKRIEMGRRALQIVQENSGALDRTVEMVLDHIDEELYVAPRDVPF